VVTGGARRIGRVFSLGVARAGGNVIIQHGHSSTDEEELQAENTSLGGGLISYKLTWQILARRLISSPAPSSLGLYMAW